MRLDRQEVYRESSSSDYVIPTAAECFSDGTMLEYVLVKGKPKLLVWRRGKPRLDDQFMFGAKAYQPMLLDPSVLRAVRFPAGTASYESVNALVGRILDVTSRISGLPERELRAIPYWALSTWFPELVPMLPTLAVFSPSPADAHRFLRLLRCICRRGVLLIGLTSAGLLTLPAHLRPTLLIEHSQPSGKMRELLEASSRRGAYLFRSGGFIGRGYSTAVYSRDDGFSAEPQEGVLTVSLLPGGGKTAAFGTPEEEELAAEFQPQLLRFRLENFQAVRECGFDAPEFTTGTRELARSLVAVILGDPNLTKGVVSLLSAQDQEVRADWTMRPEFATVVALLAFIHERKDARLPVKKLTEYVNAALSASGELKQFSPVEVGCLLTRLGVPRSRYAGGMAVEFTRQVSVRVHELGERYGVATSPGFAGCPDCDRSRVPADEQAMQAV